MHVHRGMNGTVQAKESIRIIICDMVCQAASYSHGDTTRDSSCDTGTVTCKINRPLGKQSCGPRSSNESLRFTRNQIKRSGCITCSISHG